MTRWLVVAVFSLGLVVACDDDDSKPSGAGGAGGKADGAAGQGGSVAGQGGSVAGQGGSVAGQGGSIKVDGGGDVAADGAPGTGGAPDGGSDGPDADGALPDGGNSDAPMMMSSALITTAAGGKLMIGGATLTIPAGALAADKTLTVTVRAPGAGDPGSANIVGNIYELGPNGTTFVVPVALTLPLATTVPSDKKAVVAYLDAASGQWFPVATTVGAGAVTGRIAHFSEYAVLQIPKDEQCPFSGGCGGNVEGTWQFTQSCVAPKESVAFNCEGAGDQMMREEYSIGGMVTFAGGQATITQQLKATGTIFYTSACLAVIRQSMPTTDCATLQAAWRATNADPNHPEKTAWVCLGSVDQGCACQLSNEGGRTITATYTIDGNKIAITPTGAMAEPASDYCVQGNNLTVHDADGTVYTAVKK
jgi:hypothetical protein